MAGRQRGEGREERRVRRSTHCIISVLDQCTDPLKSKGIRFEINRCPGEAEFSANGEFSQSGLVNPDTELYSVTHPDPFWEVMLISMEG